MQFINHTPFPALAYAGIDPLGQEFHVIVLRQTLTWNETGELVFAKEQAPLCEADERFEDESEDAGSVEVRQESDLCPYKPRSDVIVNATAYAPRTAKTKHVRQFEVRVVVKRPDTPAASPLKPHGLNPLQPPSEAAMAQYRAQVLYAQSHPVPGRRLIDKTLRVMGERQFVKRPGLIRWCAAMVKLATLGVVRVRPWRLTARQAVESVPVRLTRAFGGASRVEANSQAAAKVPKKYRLKSEAAQLQAGGAAPPIAQDALAANSAGCGFVPNWYLEATRTRGLRAPQIEYRKTPLTASVLNRVRAGKLDERIAASLVAGLGVRPKAHPERAKRAGTVDAAFIESGEALPEDFDFAVWNAAWPDQQIDAFEGDEEIELTNLCEPEGLGVRCDAVGNTVLRLFLPAQQPYVLLRFESGRLAPMQAAIDTLIIEPDQRMASLVYRVVLAREEPIRRMELRQMLRSQWQAGSNAASELQRIKAVKINEGSVANG